MFATVYLLQYCWSSFLKEILCTRQTVADIFACSFNIRLNSAILFTTEHFKLGQKMCICIQLDGSFRVRYWSTSQLFYWFLSSFKSAGRFIEFIL